MGTSAQCSGSFLSDRHEPRCERLGGPRNDGRADDHSNAPFIIVVDSVENVEASTRLILPCTIREPGPPPESGDRSVTGQLLARR
jgi:hypothetical protein